MPAMSAMTGPILKCMFIIVDPFGRANCQMLVKIATYQLLQANNYNYANISASVSSSDKHLTDFHVDGLLRMR